MLHSFGGRRCSSLTLCANDYKLVCVYIGRYSEICRQKKELIMIIRKKFIEKYNDAFMFLGCKKETINTGELGFQIDILKDAVGHLGRFYAKMQADGNDDLELDIADAVALEMAVLDDIANRLRDVRNDMICVEIIEEIEYERKKRTIRSRKLSSLAVLNPSLSKKEGS